MKNFFNRFMKKYEKSRLFRLTYSIWIFGIGIYTSSLLSHKYWFIRAMIQTCATFMIYIPFMKLKKEIKK